MFFDKQTGMFNLDEVIHSRPTFKKDYGRSTGYG
jgi:hypothetical protein